MKKTLLIVFGTRPEAIKMAPLINALKKQDKYFKTVICVTAQHREMLDQVLKLFGIKPDYDLDIMKSGQDLYDITSRVLIGMRDVINSVKPDLILVHGDTSTSTSAALAAYYSRIPLGHVEAGLRTYNRYSPWPEEINRQITGRIASFHFAPTENSKANLLNEGQNAEDILVTGNTVIDALKQVVFKLNENSSMFNDAKHIIFNQGIGNDIIDNWISKTRKMILITGHRRENFGQGFLEICFAIKELSLKFPNIDFVYPMHLNPNVREAVSAVFDENGNFGINNSNTFFIEPVDYLPFIFLLNSCYLVLTDSGGIQEEAPSLGKPVLVMRSTTERPEALEAGTVKLVGTNREMIINEVSKLILDENYYFNMSKSHNPYGDGNASKKIVDFLISKFQFET
jgi:UDP-N-acetylglucosamine 2-epimerase (non-hydrolysing)